MANKQTKESEISNQPAAVSPSVGIISAPAELVQRLANGEDTAPTEIAMGPSPFDAYTPSAGGAPAAASAAEGWTDDDEAAWQEYLDDDGPAVPSTIPGGGSSEQVTRRINRTEDSARGNPRPQSFIPVPSGSVVRSLDPADRTVSIMGVDQLFTQHGWDPDASYSVVRSGSGYAIVPATGEGNLTIANGNAAFSLPAIAAASQMSSGEGQMWGVLGASFLGGLMNWAIASRQARTQLRMQREALDAQFELINRREEAVQQEREDARERQTSVLRVLSERSRQRAGKKG